MQINFRFFFGNVDISAWTRCIFVANFVQIFSSTMEILAWCEIQYGRRPPSWICWRSLGTTHEGPFMMAIPCKNFVVFVVDACLYSLAKTSRSSGLTPNVYENVVQTPNRYIFPLSFRKCCSCYSFLLPCSCDSWSDCRLPPDFVNEQVSTMWFMVCYWPFARQMACLPRKWFSRRSAGRGRSDSRLANNSVVTTEADKQSSLHCAVTSTSVCCHVWPYWMSTVEMQAEGKGDQRHQRIPADLDAFR